MDGLNEHRIAPSLYIDITQGTQLHTPAGIKRMQKTFGWSLAKLLLHHPEKIRLNRLKLKMSAVLNSVAALRTFRATPLE